MFFGKMNIFLEIFRYCFVGGISSVVYFLANVTLYYFGVSSFVSIATAWLLSAAFSYIGMILRAKKIRYVMGRCESTGCHILT